MYLQLIKIIMKNIRFNFYHLNVQKITLNYLLFGSYKILNHMMLLLISYNISPNNTKIN